MNSALDPLVPVPAIEGHGVEGRVQMQLGDAAFDRHFLGALEDLRAHAAPAGARMNVDRPKLACGRSDRAETDDAPVLLRDHEERFSALQGMAGLVDTGLVRLSGPISENLRRVEVHGRRVHGGMVDDILCIRGCSRPDVHGSDRAVRDLRTKENGVESDSARRGKAYPPNE
jgi:hypothetical protein